MERIEHEGTVFWRNGGKNSALWAYPGGLIAPDVLQETLNAVYAETLAPETMDCRSLVESGDEFRASGSLGLAVQFYEYASRKASRKQLQFLLPRLTSLLRFQGRPEKVIELLRFAKDKYGSGMITAASLTSAGAAYCDLKDYKRALKCCNRAYAMMNGKADEELKMVYRRIQSESDEMEMSGIVQEQAQQV